MRRPPSFRCQRDGRTVLFGGLVLITVACGGGTDSSTVNSCPVYNVDCDSMSTAVELEPANARYHLSPYAWNDDPSIAQGTPIAGSLYQGLNYPEIDQGTYQYRPGSDPTYDLPDSNDWGIAHLMNTIEFVGRERDLVASNTIACTYFDVINGQNPAARFGVGDISKLGGGAWYDDDGSARHPGMSHQNGTDVDIRYLHKGGGETYLWLTTATDYDTIGTRDLMNCFIATGSIDLIYADSSRLGFWNPPGGGPLVNDSSHYTHFHVRVHPN